MFGIVIYEKEVILIIMLPQHIAKKVGSLVVFKCNYFMIHKIENDLHSIENEENLFHDLEFITKKKKKKLYIKCHVK